VNVPGLLAVMLLAFDGAAHASGAASADCERRPTATVEAWIAMAAPRPADTLVTAQVCIATRSAATKVGSYTGELRYDSTSVQVLKVERGAGGMRVENATRRGEVKFAGAAPNGFPEGAVMTLSLRVTRRGMKPALRLRFVELNAANGTSLLPQLVVHSP
jgi:hypothetical protein